MDITRSFGQRLDSKLVAALLLDCVSLMRTTYSKTLLLYFQFSSRAWHRFTFLISLLPFMFGYCSKIH